MTTKNKISWLRERLNPGQKSNSQVEKMGDKVASQSLAVAEVLLWKRIAS